MSIFLKKELTLRNIWLGIDLGASKLRLLAFSKEGKLIQKTVQESPFAPISRNQVKLDFLFPSHPLPLRLAHFLLQEVKKFLSKEKAVPLGIGIIVAGRIFDQEGFLGGNTPCRFANEKGYIPLRSFFQSAFPNIPIVLENDATATAQFFGQYSESCLGIPKEKVYFATVSTGIGGGGNLPGIHELGHIPQEGILPPSCGCGRPGCLEAYASGTGLSKRCKELLHSPEQKLQELERWEQLRWQSPIPLTKWVQEWCEENTSPATLFQNWDKDFIPKNLPSYLILDGAKRISLTLLSLCFLLDLKIFFLSGGLLIHQPAYFKAIQHFFQKLSHPKSQLLPILPSLLLSPFPKETASDYASLSLLIPLSQSLFQKLLIS